MTGIGITEEREISLRARENPPWRDSRKIEDDSGDDDRTVGKHAGCSAASALAHENKSRRCVDRRSFFPQRPRRCRYRLQAVVGGAPARAGSTIDLQKPGIEPGEGSGRPQHSMHRTMANSIPGDPLVANRESPDQSRGRARSSIALCRSTKCSLIRSHWAPTR